MTTNYATILYETPNQLRYVSQTHSFQALGNPQNSNLPISTILGSNAHVNVMSLTQSSVNIETNTRCKKQLLGAQANTPNLPTYTWYENATTGMYQPATNEIAFSTNSTEKIRVTSSGNVGIGTTNPQSTLYIHGTAYSTSNLTTSMSIGTMAAPSRRFNVTNNDINATSNQLVTFYNSTPVFSIRSDARVGVGTASPVSFFQVNCSGFSNQAGITLYNPNSSGTQDAPLLLKVANTSGRAYISYEIGSTGWSSGIENNTFKIKNISQFRANTNISSSPFLISSIGNVGIGISDPLGKLHVTGDMVLDGILKIRKFGFESGWDLQLSSGDYLLTSFAQRGVLIQNRLEVTDNIRTNKIYISGNNMDATLNENAFEVANGKSSFREDVDIIGLLYVETGIAQPSSDSRLKTNVQTIGNALEKICSLRGVTFNWKVPEVHKTQGGVGFIAQELAQVFPQAIVRGSYSPEEAPYLNGDRNCLSYTISSEFYAHLVESIKELKSRVEKLETELAAKNN